MLMGHAAAGLSPRGVSQFFGIVWFRTTFTRPEADGGGRSATQSAGLPQRERQKPAR
jgi:hypothetical protein